MIKPVITQTDYKLFRDLLQTHEHDEKKRLGIELMKATIVDDNEADEHRVRLNSLVEVQDLSKHKVITLQIVMPDSVDLKSRRISVFAPLSVALLGYRVGDTIKWTLPAGETSFRINKVTNV